MVYPDYRRLGIFKTLFDFVLEEWKKRKDKRLLLLCDRNSLPGQAFIQSLQSINYDHSEYEMFLRRSPRKYVTQKGITLRKATNADAGEIAHQNTLYFGGKEEENILLPEEKASEGLFIYMAELDKAIVGKVHLEISSDGIGGIYGLGVLPEYRRKGYGREILSLAIEKLREEYKAKDIMLQVDVKNDKALDLYRSCGFEVTSVMDYYEFKSV